MDAKLKHLEFIQAVVNRLASNSFSMKGWNVALVAALFVLLARDHQLDSPWLGGLPVLTFWGLDAYYLLQERLFRDLYKTVASLGEAELDFSMDTRPFRRGWKRTWFGVLLSRTVWPFHVTLIATAALIVYFNR